MNPRRWAAILHAMASPRSLPRGLRVLGFLPLLGLVAPACSSGGELDGAPSGGAGAAGSPGTCQGLDCFPAGGDGHADPFGAKAAGQARAGRIKDASQIVQAPDARQKLAIGDFWLTNDKVAFSIEDKGLSDGYNRFGGEILTVDLVGADGRPLGRSRYNETLMGFSREVIKPDSVSVAADGSDGKEAIVRVRGKLAPIEFLGNLATIFPNEYGFPAVVDYVLAPGAEKLLIRVALTNDGEEDVTVKSDEMHGFFHYAWSRLYTREGGFASPKGTMDFAAFDNGQVGFAWRSPRGKLTWGVEISGFQLANGPGFSIAKGETKVLDHAEVIVGGPQLDDLLQAIARTDGDTSRRAVSGKLTDASGAPVAGAFVHGVDGSGLELTRTVTQADGSFTVHLPSAGAKLVPSEQGYPPHAGTDVGAATSTQDLQFAPHGTIVVHVREKGTGVHVPARVQVIPKEALPPTPATRGVLDEANGRLWADFAVTGDTTLVVPPGDHRVVVTRGQEWELFDQTVTVAAGATQELTATLEHSVDTTGVLCADFHIHSFYSADSADPVVHKVKGAIADGLDIPVSSEHEWIIDFQPVIEELGLTEWAFGAPSEELTTFTWGHFGVLPLRPKDDRVNRGAMDWIGKMPDQFFGEVHDEPDKPILIINHPSGGGFGAYFSATDFDPKVGKGMKSDLWSEKFEAVEVYNDSDFDSNRTKSVRDWMSLLARGKRVWSVGGSDSHAIRTSPVGYPRTCIFFGHDDPKKLTPDLIRDALMTGNATVSGGLYLTVKGPGGEAPGGTITAGDAEVTLDVTVRAPSWLSADTLEVLRDGATLTTIPLGAPTGPGPGKVWSVKVPVSKQTGKSESFVIFHAKSAKDVDLAPLYPGRRPFAASNPIFLQ